MNPSVTLAAKVAIVPGTDGADAESLGIGHNKASPFNGLQVSTEFRMEERVRDL